MTRIYLQTIESPLNNYLLWCILTGDWVYYEVTKRPKWGIGEEHFTSEDTESEARQAIADAYLADCREAYE